MFWSMETVVPVPIMVTVLPLFIKTGNTHTQIMILQTITRSFQKVGEGRKSQK